MRHAAALLTLLSIGVPAAAATVTDVVTRSGPVQGVASDAGIVAFKGIPYAAPPVGPLRWRSPQPAAAWTAPRDATRFGTPCFASPLPGPMQAPPQSEDCLTLNVWTPPAAAKAVKRPVMVWIHGGGFEFGSSAQPGYDGTVLAKHGVVVVSFNYRLGVLGFLAHPALDREGPGSGNFGVQDQVAALRWVRANIAAFGGDPANVTIFGESAGAHSVGLLMASPLAKGLFAKAIAESGAFWDSEHGSLSTHAEATARGVAFQQRVGAADLAALRAMPADQLNMAGRWDVRLDPGTTVFSPSIDGYVLREAPAATFARGAAARVPLLAGWNAREETPLFLPRALPHDTPEAFQAGEALLFGADRMAAAAAVYPSADPARSAATLVGDLVIAEQTWEMLALQQQARRTGVYAYQFSFTSPYSPIANHTAEVKYVFGNLAPPPPGRGGDLPGDGDRATADLMTAYWTNFAIKGDPNGPGLPTWPSYAGPGSQVLAFTPNGTAAAGETGTDRFRFIRSFRDAGKLPERWRTVMP
ncbi:carboxylesterase/lipase family protein [Sphingomonas bacterium]|uniref:carboxylesterase/lipase family protein n=1 Tax=Sphingomonas bacterium TaxID=1895847 RepID=UPI001576FCF5|nr:carboxylesterase family protein [Sphingomonas bacterium]